MSDDVTLLLSVCEFVKSEEEEEEAARARDKGICQNARSSPPR